MKVRIKFTKEGPMKFVGHLDTMRYFQKAVRRAELPVAFSGGYSPHMIMSFAAPLGVGITSLGEYFDMELTRTLPTEEIRRRLDAQMVEGIRVLSARQVENGKAGKAMALVAAADYLVSFREGKAPGSRTTLASGMGDCPAASGSAVSPGWKERVGDFMAQPSVMVTKEGKKGEKQVDIRPFIYRMEARGDSIFLRLASASANYTRPDTVMESFYAWLGEEMPEFACIVQRLEVYAKREEDFVPLESLGEEVE